MNSVETLRVTGDGVEVALAWLSMQGHDHPVNEDAVSIYADISADNPRFLALAVGDGVSGSPDGELASDIAVCSFTDATRDLWLPGMPLHTLLAKGLGHAHGQLWAEKQADNINPNAATAIVALLVDLKTGDLEYGWAGDPYLATVDPNGFLDHVIRRSMQYLDGDDESSYRLGFRNRQSDVTRVLLATDGIEGIRDRKDLLSVPPDQELTPTMLDRAVAADRARALNHWETPDKAAQELVRGSAWKQNAAGGDEFFDDTTVAVLDIIRV